MEPKVYLSGGHVSVRTQRQDGKKWLFMNETGTLANVRQEETRQDRTQGQAAAELTCFKVAEVPFASQDLQRDLWGDADI